jgi:hypothetical protein
MLFPLTLTTARTSASTYVVINSIANESSVSDGVSEIPFIRPVATSEDIIISWYYLVRLSCLSRKINSAIKPLIL